jgi:nitroreductase
MGEATTFEGINNPEIIISYDEMYQFFRAHRSIRRFKQEKVPNEILRKIFDAMQVAPTARNMRSESYLLLSDTEKITALSDAVIDQILNDPGLNQIYGDRFLDLKKVFKSPIFFDAPHVLFVSSRLDNEIEANNIGIIVSYGRLAAQALGLGSCWNGLTQWALSVNRDIKKMVGIKGKKFGVFTIGYPKVKYYRTAPRSIKPVKGLDG